MALSDIEGKHRALYRAHWQLTGGGQTLHDAITSIAKDCRHSDDRAKFKAVVATLEVARDKADEAWKAVSEARIELFRLTGCDGSCSEK